MGYSSITVRAKSAAWEAYSDQYEFKPSKICKCHDKVNYVELCKKNTAHLRILMLHHNRLPSVKITRPKLNVTAMSDHLLVQWHILSYVSQNQYHCQVKYSKVCLSLIS